MVVKHKCGTLVMLSDQFEYNQVLLAVNPYCNSDNRLMYALTYIIL